MKSTLKTETSEVSSLNKIHRVNLKLDLTFWVFLPYTEQISYIIDNTVYKPISYRFLCFALIIVKDSNKLAEYEVNPKVAEYNKGNKRNV